MNLSAARKKAAKTLRQAVEKSLGQLGMESSRFIIEFEVEEDERGSVEHEGRLLRANQHGIDSVAFHISAMYVRLLRQATSGIDAADIY